MRGDQHGDMLTSGEVRGESVVRKGMGGQMDVWQKGAGEQYASVPRSAECVGHGRRRGGGRGGGGEISRGAGMGKGGGGCSSRNGGGREGARVIRGG